MDDKKMVPVEDKPAKIIKGSTKEVKKSVGKKIGEFFFEENGKSVLGWLVEDVLKPGIKDLFYDMIVNGARGAFYGTGRRSRSESTSSSYERSRYENRFKSNSSDRRTANKPQRRNGGWDIEEVFEEMRDAQDVLDAMRDRIDKFGLTTVADFYDFIGKTIPPGQYTSVDYGWDDLTDVNVCHNREGFYIDLPRPKYIS